MSLTLFTGVIPSQHISSVTGDDTFARAMINQEL